jgi:hypothetical protein
VADLYWKHYESWGPTEAVADELGVDYRKASGLVSQARQYGFIDRQRRARWR